MRILALGAATMALGAALLVLDVPGWNTAWFLFAWVGWLLVMDGGIALSGGVPFTGGRRRELAAMMLVSTPYWCLFEAYNLVMHNWYYVFLPRSEVVQACYAAVAFATVLPACFVHADLLRIWGVFDRVRWRPWRLGRMGLTVLAVLGVACVVLPLTHPRYAYALVWGAPLGIPLVLNQRLPGPSLLRDLETGEPARLLRLLAGGVVAGGMWEGMNFWARTKWIYTVPGFEEWKLFEMPLLGFLGFPTLAVASFSAYRLWCHATRAGRHWEWPDAEQPGPVRPRHRYVAMTAIVVFSAGASVLTMEGAVRSERPLLSELTNDPVVLHDFYSPERFVRAASSSDDLDPERLALAKLAALSVHKGMGAQAALDLTAAGYTSVVDVGNADADELSAALAHVERPPTAAQVRVWIRAARNARSWSDYRR